MVTEGARMRRVNSRMFCLSERRELDLEGERAFGTEGVAEGTTVHGERREGVSVGSEGFLLMDKMGGRKD